MLLQHALSRRLVWSESTACRACGGALEVDGSGFVSLHLRVAIVAAHGVWGVHLDSTRLAAADALRRALDLSSRRALELARAVPGVVWRGTFVEAERLIARLRHLGVASTRVREPDDAPLSVDGAEAAERWYP